MITLNTLSENLQVDAVKLFIAYAIKKTIWSPKARVFYKTVYETAKFVILIITLFGLFFLILKGKLPNSTKLVIGVGLMLYVSILCYFFSKERNMK